MLAVGDSLHQPCDLLAAENLRLCDRRLGRRDGKAGAGPAQGDFIEEAQSVDRHVQRTPRQPALLDQNGQVRLHLVFTQCVGGTTIILGQAHHGPDIGILGERGQSPDQQILRHLCP